MVFFARSPRMRDLSYFQCRAMLGERAQEKTTAPPTLGKETIEVNHYRVVSGRASLHARNEETTRSLAGEGDWRCSLNVRRGSTPQDQGHKWEVVARCVALN